MTDLEATDDSELLTIDLGTQCHVSGIKDTCLGVGPDGAPLWFAVLDGSPVDPTYLIAVDPATGGIADRVPIDELTGPKAVTQTPNGDVFLAGYHPGQLYRWRPGEPTAEGLGLPMPGVQFIWSLASTADGAVFGGTWPTGSVFRWHPDAGFAHVGPVPVGPDVEYVRCIAVDDANQFAVIGYGTQGGCLVLDLRTGEELRPYAETFAEAAFVYDAEVRDGLVSVVTDRGDGTVFRVRRGPAGLETTLEFNVAAADPVAPAIVDPGAALVAVKTPNEGIIIQGPAGPVQRLAGSSFGGAKRLHPSTDGRQLRYLGPTGAGTIDRDTGEHTRVQVEQLPLAAQAISAVTYGPGNRLMAGGFLNGGVLINDLDNGQRTQLGPIGQPEVLAVWDDALVVGAYPGAKIHVLPPETLTQKGFRPEPCAEFADAGQDRPYAFAARDRERGYLGFMADYGRLPGAVVELRRNGDEILAGEPWFDVGDRSVISLLVSGDQLYGTTMIDGGMGIRPTEREAVLFRRNLKTGAVDHWTPPVAPCRAIYSVVDLGGRLAMFAEHRLVIFDPSAETWQVIDLGVPPFSDDPGIRLTAHGAFLRTHPDGALYATVHGAGLLRIDPVTFSAKVLWRGRATHLAVDGEGGLAFADAETLRLIRITRW